MYPISSNGLNKDSDTEIYFFTTAFHPFDNFSAHVVRMWNRRFLTSEYAYQWKKFSVTAPEVAEQIYEADSADIVKNISLAHTDKIPQNWDKDKVAIMEEILRTKAQQHADILEVLKNSGNRTIIENSPYDAFWGIGKDGNGENTLGKLWMKIRDELVT